MRKLALFLAVIFMLPCLVSCKKNRKSSSAKTISEESSWWNDTVTEIPWEDINSSQNNHLSNPIVHYACPDEDSVVVMYSAYSNSRGYVNILRHYSYDGTLLGEVVLNDYFGEKDFNFDHLVFTRGGKYYAQVSFYDEANDTYTDQGYEIDFENGTLKDPIPLKLPESESEFGSGILRVIGSGDDLVYLCNMVDDGEVSYRIFAVNGSDCRTFTPDFGRNNKINIIDNFTNCEKGVSFMAEVLEAGSVKNYFCTLDTSSFEMKKTEISNMSRFTQFYTNPNSEAFACGEHEITRIDLATGTESEFLKFFDTYWAGEYRNANVLRVTDNEVILLSEEQNYLGTDPTVRLMKFQKADKNPNAGRKALSLAFFSLLDDAEYSAINDFNKTSKEYFVEATDKYYLIAEQSFDESTGESFLAQQLSGKADAMDLLISDIKSGTGPDLVLFDSEFEKLNNPDYLLDLSSRIEKEASLNSGDYLDFVLTPNGRDGKHYRLNYKYNFEGINVKTDFLSAGSKGMTFSEYDQIISEKNLGKSVLYSDDLILLSEMVKTADCFSYDDSGKFTIDTKDFRSIAGYIASIPDSLEYDDGLMNMNNIELLQVMNSYEFTTQHSDAFSSHSIVGLPSEEPKPEAIFAKGIGITSTTACEDGAWEFAMTLMSPEIQRTLTVNDPVLKSALKENLLGFIRLYNEREASMDYLPPIDEGMADWYISELSDAIVVPDINPTILSIMCEEMPAYFAGDKSLDEVISTIDNRVNLMLREQG